MRLATKFPKARKAWSKACRKHRPEAILAAKAAYGRPAGDHVAQGPRRLDVWLEGRDVHAFAAGRRRRVGG
ncbi:MAG: hypothetical protein WDM92_06485 [Caulobacteraceae bacterium]